ncbi:MAG: circadian clock protein KaiC, partial [Pseudomonadota bacterium]|nr:circadian clock protein KaiC [Pseudomonadota bacterium]
MYLTTTQPIRSIPKLKTHIEGLDKILHGGIPQGQTTIINGGPGSGKSILALQLLYQNVVIEQKKAILINFEERVASIRRNALTLGWDLTLLEQQQQLLIIDAHQHLKPDILISGDFTLSGLITLIKKQAQRMNAQILIIDAIDTLLRLFSHTHQQLQQLQLLHRSLSELELTLLITTKTSLDESLFSSILDYMADCIIYLDKQWVKQIPIRYLQVTKYRGSGFNQNRHPFAITKEGININPISDVQLEYNLLGNKISTGVGQLDQILRGGYPKNSCLLIVGVSGSGKSTLAATLLDQACQQGEQVYYVSFEEPAESIIANMRSCGLDLEVHRQNGQLRFLSLLPESIGIEEHLIILFREIEQYQPSYLVIDAISAYQRMGNQQLAFDYFIRLWYLCKVKKLTSIFISQTYTDAEVQTFAQLEITSLIDVVITLNLSIQDKAIMRTLLVLKARGIGHDNQYQQFKITDTGVKM